MSRERSKARRLALQALYQWQLTGQGVGDIEAQFRTERELPGADLDYFQELLGQTLARCEEFSTLLAPHLDRPVAQLDPVERAILWLGCYELLVRVDVPYRVAINEAVELAKAFGGESAHRYINAILDRVAREARGAEHGVARAPVA